MVNWFGVLILLLAGLLIVLGWRGTYPQVFEMLTGTPWPGTKPAGKP